MRIHIIACQVLGRELNYYSALSDNIVDITWLPQGLHDTPNLLREEVVKAIGKIEADRKQKRLKHEPDYIALGYGLCSNGVIGVQSGTIPLVIPKTDDCIALFLGSQKRYLELFYQYNGTYWYNNGWIESSVLHNEQRYEQLYNYYVEEYGEDNADYLLEQDKLWVKNYKYCGYITSPIYHNPDYIARSQALADFHGWELVQFEGDSRMIKDLVDGRWDETEFLICPPNHEIIATYDGTKIACKPI